MDVRQCQSRTEQVFKLTRCSEWVVKPNDTETKGFDQQCYDVEAKGFDQHAHVARDHCKRNRGNASTWKSLVELLVDRGTHTSRFVQGCSAAMLIEFQRENVLPMT